MRLAPAARMLPALMLAGAAAPGPVQGLAGEYSQSFENALVSGERYDSENLAQIVPVDARHAYVQLDLEFYNGHSCGFYGIAHVDGDALVYRAPASPADGEPPCELRIRRAGKQLAWDDGGTCHAQCGARGSLSNGTLPWHSRQPIADIARLKASSAYAQAMQEWKEMGSP